MERRVSGDGRRVVVSGMGVVAGHCAGQPGFSTALRQGLLEAAAVDRAHQYHRPGGATTAVTVHDVDLSPWMPAAAARRLTRQSVFAVVAARMAVGDAGLADGDHRATQVVMATAFGAVGATEHIVRAAHLDGPELVSPSVFPESVANAPAAHVGIALGAHGPSVTIVRREAGALAAVARGADAVAGGDAEAAIVGCAEEIPPVLHAFLDRFDALARATATHSEAARPFDRYRNGFLAAEGATLLILEPEDTARARGARIYARVAGHASAFDPTASRVGFGRGSARFGAAIRRLLASAGATPADVGRVVSGASGAVGGDRLEAEALAAAWGETPLPPVTTPKRVTGEYGGGFLAAAVLGPSGCTCPPDLHRVPDPTLPVDPPIDDRREPASLTLVTSLAAGGAASWLLLEAAA